MTNSFRRRPFAAFCGGSQKRDKRIGNRRMRRVNRVLMQKNPESVFRSKDEMMNPWGWTQDGTRHYRPFSRYIGRNRLGLSVEELYRSWYRWAKAK